MRKDNKFKMFLSVKQQIKFQVTQNDKCVYVIHTKLVHFDNGLNFRPVNTIIKPMIKPLLSLERTKQIDRLLERAIKNNRLQLINCKMGDDGMKYFLSSGSAEKIEYLRLSKSRITSISIQALTQAQWPHLLRIDISSERIGSKGCFWLSQGDWKDLRVLSINDCQIENEGIKHLAKGQFKFLEELTVSHNYLTTTGLKALTQGNWKLLQKINFNSGFVQTSTHLQRFMTLQGCIQILYGDWKDAQIANFKKNRDKVDIVSSI